MADQPSDKDPGEHAALDSLDRRLDAVRDRTAEAKRQQVEADPRQTRALGKAWSLAIEMVAAVGVCLFIGWWVDRWFGTAPWGLLGFILLGVATAMWSAIRTAMAMQRQQMADSADAAGTRKEE
jgi:ATP synthase protein I